MSDNIIQIDGEKRVVRVQVLFIKEGKYIIAQAPALDLSTFGDTIEEAKEAFAEALDLFMDHLVEHGTLDEVLSGLGWQQEDERWVPPMVISQSIESIEIPAHLCPCPS
jgi:predicted RNase H-like HicB family nuclease